MMALQLYTVIGAAGLLVCLACLIALHLLPTGFHPIHDPVSNYGTSLYGYLYRLQAFASGICGACLLAVFAGTSIPLPFWGIAALGCYSVSRMLIIFFPTDIKPPRTLKGSIHVFLAALTFTGIAIAAGNLTQLLIRVVTWGSWGWELQAAAFLTEGAAVAFFLVFKFRPFRKITGLIERCIYLGTLLWLGIVFMQLLRSF
jgi:hypothetical protein